MNILSAHKLFTASPEGWDAYARSEPSTARLFALVVLPFSLIPPLMLEYAGRHVGRILFPDVGAMTWSMTALVFLLAELLTVPLLAWAIRSVAERQGVATHYRDAFLLAAIAAVPLWLSSLALFSDWIPLIAVVIGLGLAASVALIFRGARSVLNVDEGLLAFDIAYTVTALGLVAWALLVVLALVPIIA